LLTILLSGCASKPPEPAVHWYSEMEAMLWSDIFTSVTVEVDYVEPYKPSAYALGALEEKLSSLAQKRSVKILPPTPIPPQGQFVSANHLAGIHHKFGNVTKPNWFHNGTTALLHVVYLEGAYETPVMGIHRAGFIALFPRDYDEVRGVNWPKPPPQVSERQKLERMVLTHELGHAFGLVNCGIPMVRPHQTKPGDCHSDQPASVMSNYDNIDPQTDRAAWLNKTVEGQKFEFDAYDVEDVRAFQAKAPKGAMVPTYPYAAGVASGDSTDLPSMRSVMTRVHSSRIT
jgi:hypothetical protein